MEEDRLFCLLNNLNFTPIESDTAFPRLNPNVVRNVAKNMVAVLCNPGKDKVQSRMGYIKLVKNLCRKQADHMAVNEQNYKSFLDVSPLSRENVDPYLYMFEKEIQANTGNTVNNQPENIMENVLQFFTLQTENSESKAERLDFINASNQKTFIDFDYIPSKKLETIEIKNLLCNFKDTEEQHIDEKGSPPNQHMVESENRESNIKVGYAVINLNAPTKIKVLRNIVSELRLCSPLKSFEIEFLKFAFENADELQAELLEHFPFLIEQPLINIGRSLLKKSSVIKTDERLKFIEKCVIIKPTIIHNVLRITYELFALSNYNNSILELINLLKSNEQINDIE